MEIHEFAKVLAGGLGFATTIGWLYKRLVQLENRMRNMEREILTKPSEKEMRQTIIDLQAPLQKDIDYIKIKSTETSDKLDTILAKVLGN